MRGGKRWGQLLLMFLAEIFATYLFAVVVLSVAQHGYSHHTIAMTEASALFVVILIFSKEYAGHLSPFVTIALYFGGKIPYPWLTSIVFLVGSTIGWILGSATTIGLTINADRTLGLGTPELSTNYTEAQGFLAECLGTCISFGVAMFLLYGYDRRTLYADVSSESKYGMFFYPFGAAVGHYLGVIVTAYVSGASLNPHRFFWPAIMSGKFDAPTQWFYFVGPLIGVLISGLLYAVFIMLDNWSYSSKAKTKDTIKNTLGGKFESESESKSMMMDDKMG